MKVAIVCGAPSSEFMAPYDDPDWEIWVLGNRLDRHIDKRVDRVFEVHEHLDHEKPEEYKQWLTKTCIDNNYELVVSDLSWGLWASVFPYEAAENLYGSTYLTSSPAYMMAYALLQGATSIAVYGVDLSVDDHEYFWQRPCMEAWIGFAKGRGVEVIIPDVSHIGKSDYVEGRDWNGDKKKGVGPFTEEEFVNMAKSHEDKIAELQMKITAHDGARQAYTRLAKVARAVQAGVSVETLSETATVK